MPKSPRSRVQTSRAGRTCFRDRFLIQPDDFQHLACFLGRKCSTSCSMAPSSSFSQKAHWECCRSILSLGRGHFVHVPFCLHFAAGPFRSFRTASRFGSCCELVDTECAMSFDCHSECSGAVPLLDWPMAALLPDSHCFGRTSSAVQGSDGCTDRPQQWHADQNSACAPHTDPAACCSLPASIPSGTMSGDSSFRAMNWFQNLVAASCQLAGFTESGY